MDWLRKWMYGRHGIDQLGVALMILYLVLSLIGRMFRFVPLWLLSAVPLVLCLYRMLSRDHTKRVQENIRFLQWWSPLARWAHGFAARLKDRRTHRYFKCPQCGSTLRVPKGKGKIRITCPVCRTEFVKKT